MSSENDSETDHWSQSPRWAARSDIVDHLWITSVDAPRYAHGLDACLPLNICAVAPGGETS
jgi:hypothetical protein